jgi:hypothetical protein
LRRPVVTQPWPNRAARSIERGPFAATTNGSRGCCTQPGAERASTELKYSPRIVVRFSVSSESSWVRNSVNRSTRAGVAAASPPSTTLS